MRGPTADASVNGAALVRASAGQLGWTARAVMVEPSVASGSNNDYLSPAGWKSIGTGLGYTPANDALVLHKTGAESKTGNLVVNGMTIREDTSGTTSDIDLFGWGKSQFAITDGGGSYTNVVSRLGYNIGAGGSRVDAAKAGLAFVIESKYRHNGSSPFILEYHIEGLHSEGSSFRSITGVVPHSPSDVSNQTSRLAFQNQTYVFSKYNGDVLLQIDANTINDSALFGYPGTAVHAFTKNNYIFQKQMNAAGTDFVSLPFIDSTDELVIPVVSKTVARMTITGNSASHKQQLTLVNNGSSDLGNTWNFGIGSAGDYDGYLKVTSGYASNYNDVVLRLADNATATQREVYTPGMFSAPAFSSPVPGMGSQPVVQWSQGATYSGTLLVGLGHPYGAHGVDIQLSAASGNTGNVAGTKFRVKDLDGTEHFSVTNQGAASFSGTVTASGNISGNQLISSTHVYADGQLQLAGNVRVTSSGDGIALLLNNASSGFNRIALGGMTSSFPSINRNGAGVQVKLADDSAFTSMDSSRYQINGLNYSTVAVGDDDGGWVGGYNIEWAGSAVKRVATGNASGIHNSVTGVKIFASSSGSAGSTLSPVVTVDTTGAVSFAGGITANSNSTIWGSLSCADYVAAPLLTLTGAGTGTGFIAQASGHGKCTIQKGDASHTGYVEWIDAAGDRRWYMGYNSTANEMNLVPFDASCPFALRGDVLAIGGAANDTRWNRTGTGAASLQAHYASGSTWQTPLSWGNSASGATIGFLGATPIVRQTLSAAATDAATTQTLANEIRQALISFGLAS